jgi:hypothetical protein
MYQRKNSGVCFRAANAFKASCSLKGCFATLTRDQIPTGRTARALDEESAKGQMVLIDLF